MKSFVIFCVFRVAFGISSESVPKVRLNDGNKMPGIALGTWLGLTQQGDRNKPIGNEVEDAVKWAIEAGYRHIDTAAIYGIEDQVGRGIASKIQDGTIKREDLFVTTKLWNDRHAKDAVVPALRQSLDRLALQYVDLYLIHWPFAVSKTNVIEDIDFLETWEGMRQAKGLNLTRSIGLSNFNVTQIQRVLFSAEKPAALQVEINLNLQQPELLKFAKDNNIAVMGYTPFGSLFGGKTPTPAPPPRADDLELMRIANKHKKTVPQVVLRYLVELGVVPLPKSLNKNRIEQNIDIFDFKLDSEDINSLKSFDKHFRTIPISAYKKHPYYPFGELKE